MPTGNIRRVRTVLTGVAGAPYYMTGYFTADTGTTNQVQTAWHRFVMNSATATSASIPTGCTVSTESEVQVINPVDGAIVGVETSPGITGSGTNATARQAPANQLLARWRTGNYVNRREVRGRTFLPFVFNDIVNTDGSLKPIGLTLVNDRCAALIDNPDTVFVIWSKKNGVWWAAQSGSGWDRVAVLRSRRD